MGNGTAGVRGHVYGSRRAERVQGCLDREKPVGLISDDPLHRPYVEDAELFRIPDHESAPVFVESDQEFDVMVEHLVGAGMFEREVEDETLRIKGDPVYNGLFGVHKSWKEDDSRSW